MNKVFSETGLTCSIGIANSRVVSKIASDYKKPGGITIVEDAKEFLKDMDIGKIPGIGKVTKSMYIGKTNWINIFEIHLRKRAWVAEISVETSTQAISKAIT